MKKKILSLLIISILGIGCLCGCSAAERVSQNLSQEADNFNVI